MDPSDTNAQNSNARALLSRFSDPRARWTAVCSQQPADSIRMCSHEVIRLSSSRFWGVALALLYQSKFDAVFYPGPHWADEVGLRIRTLSGRRVPVIATLEGIIASRDSVNRLSDLAGHSVFSQPGTEDRVARLCSLYQRADQIIAISPFLARAATLLYGKKVSCLPLGIAGSIFHCIGRQDPLRCRVVGCGTVKGSKHPQLFLRLAARYKEADFVWFGDGGMVGQLTAEARRMDLDNLRFPGPLAPETLAEQFRKSSFFVLPSHAEGVPKVTQEAAACGLPIVLNGYYEAPTVIHELNGLVAWSDEELIEQVGTLIHDPEARVKMGWESAGMAKKWDWDHVAPQWEDLIIRVVTR